MSKFHLNWLDDRSPVEPSDTGIVRNGIDSVEPIEGATHKEEADPGEDASEIDKMYEELGAGD
jgi:hypothetical protein